MIPAISIPPGTMSLRLAGVGVAAVAIGAALSWTGGPGFMPVAWPIMADRPVSLADGRALYVQRHEVTIAEWNSCHSNGGCTLTLRAPQGFDPATTPATGLSYVDAAEYVDWINIVTGQEFRLPTLSEWRDMAAAVLPDAPAPTFTDPALSWASAYLTKGLTPRALKPQGSFSVSPEGIADLDGNVWEWTQECYAGPDQDVPADRCAAFFVGGEHDAILSYLVRDPARGGCAVGSPPAHLGMRLVSDDKI